MGDELESLPAGAGGIFPFLSVLSCTIGAMILILVAGALKAVVKDPDLPKKFAGARERYDVAKRAVDAFGQVKSADEEAGALRAELTLLARRKADDERMAKSRTALLARTRRETAETRAIPGKLAVLRELRETELLRDRSRRERDSSKDALDASGKRIEESDADCRALRLRLAKLRELAGPPKVRFKVRGEGAQRTPVYLDLFEGSIVVHTDFGAFSAGTRISAGEKAIEELASELARPDSPCYAVFLVRPGAAKLFRKAAAVFRKWRAPFGHEPADGDWQVTPGKR